jgi:glycosyltransferase involved in cell wall biosynthesis
MRAGLPVVASSVGGIGEAIQNEETGYLIPRGDVDALKERLGRLLTDPVLRVRLGANGRRRYEEQFTLSQFVSKTLAVYRNVLGERSGSEARFTSDPVKSPNSTS